MIKIMANTVYPTCPEEQQPHDTECLFNCKVQSNTNCLTQHSRVQCYCHLVHKVISQGKGFEVLLFACDSAQHGKEEQRHGFSALLSTGMMRLWEGSCSRKGKAEARSARTAPGNVKPFIIYKMTEQKRYSPAAAPRPNACAVSFTAWSRALAPKSPAQAVPQWPKGICCAPQLTFSVGWDQDFILPRGSEAEPLNDQRDGQQLLGGTDCLSLDDGDKYDRSYKTVKSSLVIQHSALIAKNNV